MARSDTLDAPVARRPRFWTPYRRRLWTFYLIASVALAVHGAIASWRNDRAFLLNTTESLPYWALWLRVDTVPGLGDIVVFRPPASELLTTHFSPEPAPFAKRVMGLPGAAVTVVGREVFVDGRPLGIAKTLSRRGVALEPVAPGTVPPGCYVVGTPHPDSFDSRYAAIGFVCRDRILGTAEPIL